MSDTNAVSNLGLAAYLRMRGYKLSGNPTREVDGRFSFVFIISAEMLEKLNYEYLNGNYAKYDNALVSLKKMLPRY